MKCAVVANTEDEAKIYATGRRLPDWFHVQNAEQLLAAGPVRIEYTGSWRKRPDLLEVVAAVEQLEHEGKSL